MREETDLQLGIEADFIPGREDRMRTLLERRDWDYVVGSIHFLSEGRWTTTASTSGTRGRSPDHVWSTYFAWLGELAATGMYDILAHPDLVKHWGRSAPGPTRTCASTTTSRWSRSPRAGSPSRSRRPGCASPSARSTPTARSWRWSIDAGNPIALSSDAHTPEQLGFEYDRALALPRRRRA